MSPVQLKCPVTRGGWKTTAADLLKPRPQPMTPQGYQRETQGRPAVADGPGFGLQPVDNSLASLHSCLLSARLPSAGAPAQLLLGAAWFQSIFAQTLKNFNMPPFLTVMLTLRQWLINILIASGSKAAFGDKKTRAFRVNQKEVKQKAARIVGIEGRTTAQPRLTWQLDSFPSFGSSVLESHKSVSEG